MTLSIRVPRRLAALLCAGLVVGLGACSDDDGGDESGANGDPPADQITISGLAFEGATVAAGATVTIVNNDSTAHTVTSDDGSFDVDVPGENDEELTAPSAPGSYPYSCSIHTSMTGTLVVE